MSLGIFQPIWDKIKKFVFVIFISLITYLVLTTLLHYILGFEERLVHDTTLIIVALVFWGVLFLTFNKKDGKL